MEVEKKTQSIKQPWDRAGCMHWGVLGMGRVVVCCPGRNGGKKKHLGNMSCCFRTFPCV